MTDPARLTDEELAEMERRYPAIAYQPIPRLIADLRVARAEVERLREACALMRPLIVDDYAGPWGWVGAARTVMPLVDDLTAPLTPGATPYPHEGG